MYFTDRGIEELETRRGDEDIAVTWLAERMRDFVNLNPDFETAVDRLATYLARDEEEDLLSRTGWVLVLGPVGGKVRDACWCGPHPAAWVGATPVAQPLGPLLPHPASAMLPVRALPRGVNVPLSPLQGVRWHIHPPPVAAAWA
ncbi:MAG: hypothetical protein JO345_17920 [Streptosporangiaceae bacterium]|nr:hypothetical protein [Streptosporangiaceae bacterium]